MLPEEIQQIFVQALGLHRAGRLGEAEALYRRVLELHPAHPEALHYLGVVAHQTGRRELAVDLLRQATALQPDEAAGHSNLGEAWRALGRFDEAITCYRRALELEPDLAGAHNNLGIALAEQGQFEAAVAAHRRALELAADFPEACLSLGTTLIRQNRLDEAVAAFRQALELRPAYPAAYNNLGNALKAQGDLEGALAAYRQAMQFAPGQPSAQSNLIYALHFHPAGDAGAITAEQNRWNRLFSDPLQRFVTSHKNDRSPARRLRIGYVSPEFRDNVIGRYLFPLFASHDHQDVEVVCYSGVARPDGLTAEFRKCADQWRETVGVGDSALAGMIRQDGVDILVDLSLHTAGNRLLVFARRPAPIQVSFASYPAGTGLAAIGCRISDSFLESEMEDGRAEIGSELRTPNSDLRPVEQVFLVDSYWCHDPYGVEVAVNALPAQETGRVTFGCLNNFAKINEPLLRLWGRVLEKVADARLMLLTDEGNHRQRTLKILEQVGIEPGRVEFAVPRPRKAYLELYHQLDIALDPFPYHGHSTSLDALWMGVPVVSLAGVSPVSRAGYSQLANLGLPELVTFSEDDYVQTAAQLAHHLPRLASLRANLRSRMEASPLMDAPRFARNIEAAYRAMWQRWASASQSV